MKLPFVFFAFLFLLQASYAQNSDRMVKDWERAKAYTAEYLAAMPDDGINFKPTPEIRSFAEQMLHLAGANFFFASQASGKANPHQGKDLEKMDTYKNKAALAQIVAESYDYVISSLSSMTPAQMGENIKFFNQDMSRQMVLEKAFEHGTHHRGQTTVYLRLKGVKPPQEKLF